MLGSRKGFTLAELMITIVILGVLGGIALPRFFPQQEKARVAEAVAMLSAIRQGEVAYALEHSGAYLQPANAADWQLLGIDTPGGVFTYAVDAQGNATATRAGGGATYNGTTIILNINGTWGAGTHPFSPT